ncbi:hypothetical protein BU16DRAFT_620836 [Lophium mytilinum]|uniref:Uncharacterized protein n=1 Tax=Lophium mytilinum TaxID=390894 RepID=A0A6A6QK79_9PEZI|nr:hypothetical protein BU16DRAFT_620836 [Lophium mytilinum]
MFTSSPPASVPPSTAVGGSTASPQGASLGTNLPQDKINNLDDRMGSLAHNQVILDGLEAGQPFAVDIADFMMRQQSLNNRRLQYDQLKAVLDKTGKLSEVNKKGTQKLTPLHVAAQSMRFDCAELLLVHGANPHALSGDAEVAFQRYRSKRNDPERHMYEVLEFDTLIKNFPDESITVFTLAPVAPGDGYRCWDSFSMPISAMRKGSSTVESERFWLTLNNNDDRESLTWIHVPSTNGVILAKLSRDIEAMRPPYTPFPADFCRVPLNPSDPPGDPLLWYRQPVYRQPVYTLEVGVGNREEKSTTIVFPCLVLSSAKYHGNMRIKRKGASDLFKHEFADKIIHMARTLDEAYYPGLGPDALKKRNEDQVVSRDFDGSVRPGSTEHLPILLVPQLWLWSMENFVVSAFASGEQTAANEYFQNSFYDYTDYEDGRVMESFRNSFHTPGQFTSSPNLRMCLIMASRIKAFGTEYENGNERFPPTLNIFETAVVSVLSDVDDYMRNEVVDVQREGEFIHIISDIRDELVMIQDVLNQQEDVMNSCLGSGRSGDPEWREVDDARDMILAYRKRTEKIDGDAARVQQVIQDKLNLKRTAASMDQALASIKEARESKLLSLVVIGFTIITLIFTPLSFLVGLFALDIDTFGGLKYTPNGSKLSTGNSSSNSSSDVFSVGVEFLTIIITGGLTWGAMVLLLWALKKWQWTSDTKLTSEGGEKDDKSKGVGANMGPNQSAATGATVGSQTSRNDEKQGGLPKTGLSIRRRLLGENKKKNASGKGPGNV